MRSLGLVVLACAPALADTAKDDLAHRKTELAPMFANTDTCIPSETVDARWDLDAYDGHVVVCMQAMTRRGTSVFSDMVNYACWNVDPATGKASKRGDLGRSYFRCQDGACAPDSGHRAVSWDGASILTVDDKTVRVTDKAGKERASFATPKALQRQNFQSGDLTLVGHTIFAIYDDVVHAYSDAGKDLGSFDGRDLHVIDATLVASLLPAGDGGSLFDLTTNKATPLPDYQLFGAARLGSSYYRLDYKHAAIETWSAKQVSQGAEHLAVCKPR